MKIYPSRHTFVEEDRIKSKDITLSCIITDAAEKRYIIDKLVEKAATETMESVLPYEEFSRPDPYLFDKNKNRVEVSTKMIRTDGGYAFFPSGAIEFYPSQFDFRVKMKKSVPYRTDLAYDIKVGVIESNYEYAEALVSVFGDAQRRGLSPSNVYINSGEIKKESYSNNSIEECDFVFIESSDGIHYLDDEATEINFDEYLNHHTNVWLMVDALPEEFEVETSIDQLYSEIKNPNPILYNFKETMTTEKTLKNGMAPSWMEGFVVKNIIEGIGTPIIVLEKPGRGYVLISKKFFIKDIGTTSHIIYEAILKVFLESYTSTEWFSGWITDNEVDYLPRHESVFGRKHEIYKLNRLMDSSFYKDPKWLSVIDVEIMQSDVALKGVSSSNELFFEKTGNERDPEKSLGQKAYYTTRNSIILYSEDSVFRVEMPLNLMVTQSSKGDYLHIDDYKSTSLNIDSMGIQKIRIPDTEGVYCLCVNENVFSLVNDKFYDEYVDGLKLATVRSSFSSVINNYDTRIMGGGLPEDEEANFNMIDVGHIKGRPHRQGGAMVIQLPASYKPYDELVRKAVNRHVASGDLYVVVYK